jgi:hypothetical protein
MKPSVFRIAAACAGLAISAFAAQPATPGQASLTLGNNDAQFCYTHENEWTLTKALKEGSPAGPYATGQTVIWTVTAVKSSGATTFTVHGGLTVTNTGSAPATIGNIVINLQKNNSPKKGSNASHVSLAANVADSTNGDAATSANIVANGSAENAATNAAWGVNNYTTAGAKGTFVETAGSGALSFTDASNNTLFSLVPQPVIPVGQSITLLYHATFSTSILPAPGTSLRVEALVTFGNSGLRGGSGSTASNIDINGNGVVDADEANVRTVASRVTRAVPALEECNDSVSVADFATDLTTTGTVSWSGDAGFGSAVISTSGTFDVSVVVDGGALGGQICNKATLLGTGSGGTLNVIVGTTTGIIGYTPVVVDPITGATSGGDPIYGPVPVYATYECCKGVSLEADHCVTVGALPPDGPPVNGDFCSYSQGGLGGSGVPFNQLNANFATLFPAGVEVGIPGAGGYSMKFTTATAVQDYLPTGGPANKLTADSVNPTSTSAGQFGGQVLALKLNIALSDAGVTTTGFGDLIYCNAGDSLHGQTVRQILAAAETAIGGGALPAGYTYATLAGLCANLDLSFDGKDATYLNCGVVSAWATSYLRKYPCP